MAHKISFLKVSKSGEYLVEEDEKPFFWLGDTAWELLHRLDLKDTELYFRDRKEKGFNVIQTVILAELDGLNIPNANGDQPLVHLDPEQPNEDYFAHVDKVVRLAGEMGIYIGLLPTWGDKYNKKWGIGPEVFNPENAESFGKFLGNRYKDQNNIIWILGGDRIPDNEEDYLINCRLAQGLRKGNAKHLQSLHPNGGQIASDIFGKEAWLDIDMFQSRHQKGFKEFKFTRKARKNRPVRPVIDGEPGYENIPNLLNKLHLQRLDDKDVRKAAYWNMCCGAAGHTYGCNELWQIYSPENQGLFGAHFHWKEALNLPGAIQVGMMKQFFESLPWQTLIPDQTIIGGFNWENSAHITGMVNREKDLLLAYSPSGRTIKLNTFPEGENIIHGFWFDPEKGLLKALEQPYNNRLVVPDKKKDWILLMMSDKRAIEWKPPFPFME
ncbi:MAG: DUF4038 domain-containing protein [Cyclobacteriaceae bacterium]